MNDVADWMVAAAREIRIKIHDMAESNQYACCRASNKANSEWLDRAAKSDAPIIAKHAPAESEIARLREAQRWIPCSEKLPDMWAGVLAWKPSVANIYKAHLRHDGTWGDYHGDTDIEGITHWQPLPPPPEVTK